MFIERQQFVLLLGLLVLAPASAGAVNPVMWQVELSTTGQDVFWTSPTNLTTGIAEYDWSYEITELTANVFLLGNQNLLGQLGDAASGAGTETGLPFLVVDQTLSDATTGSAAMIRIEVDAAGVGRASATNITLGSVLGLPIRRVDLKANVSILGVPLGDYDRDGDVDDADYNVWQTNFGSTTSLNADGNKNRIVDAADYTIWRDNLGVDTTPAAATALITAVPEPTAWLMAMCAALAALLPQRQKKVGEPRGILPAASFPLIVSERDHRYSCLSASIGSRLAARDAG